MFPRGIPTLTVALALAFAGCTAPGADDDSDAGDGSGDGAAGAATQALEAVRLVSHIEFGVFEQDVYIERPGGLPGEVFRPTPDDAANPLTADSPLYASAEELDHDPTFMQGGPFEKGAALGFTLAEWLAAKASVAYLCTDGETARLDAAFSGLVPEGVYTFWNSRLTFTGGAITGANDVPAGEPMGTENVFTASEDGTARFSAGWEGCNEPSTGGPGIGPDGGAQVFAIAYHSDGETYGASPGPFGSATHVQLFAFSVAALE